MLLNFNLDRKFLPENIRILPEFENPDQLHDIVTRLPDLTNPSVIFSENARKGVYNHISDDEYDALLNTIKGLNELWYDKEKGKTLPSAGVFDILVRLFESFISNMQSNYIKNKPFSE